MYTPFCNSTYKLFLLLLSGWGPLLVGLPSLQDPCTWQAHAVIVGLTHSPCGISAWLHSAATVQQHVGTYSQVAKESDRHVCICASKLDVTSVLQIRRKGHVL
jgi:hypothetical protein